MSTLFRIQLYDTYYDIYKDNKLLASVNVPPVFYSETLLCFEEEDPLAPKGFSYKYFYSFFLSNIGLIPSVTSIQDFRTSIK